MRTVFLGLILSAAALSACGRNPPPVSYESAAQSIRRVYESRAGELDPKTRAHLFLRLYRSSGDAKYLEEIRIHAQNVFNNLVIHNDRIPESGYIEETSQKFLIQEGQSPKHRHRQRALEKYPLFSFYHRLTYRFYQLQCFGIDIRGGRFQNALRALAAYDFRPALLDSDIITYHASEAANTVYYLKWLGLQDLEKEFLARFREVFMAGDDRLRGAVEYENKLYGLTHIIIAASSFYQQRVSAQEYSWVLDYFSDHIDTILIRSKWDVIAEIGLSFRLAGFRDHAVITKTREAILKAFDPEKGIIPGKSRPPDLNALEHRNIVSYLLLKDYEKLYPGPDVSREIDKASVPVPG